MNVLNRLRIGARLGLGLSVVLGLSMGMLVLSLLATSAASDASVHALQTALSRKTALDDAKQLLLLSGVAIRNIGLLTEVKDTQREEVAARAFRKSFTTAVDKLAAGSSSPDAAALLEKLRAGDKAMQAPFNEAVQHAMAFDPEGSVRIITGKIDPIFRESLKTMDALFELEDRHAAQLIEASAADGRRVRQAVAAGCAIALLVAGALGWMLSRSITGPIARAVALAREVAEGNLDVRIEATGRDETRELLDSLTTMSGRLRELVSQVRESAGEISMASEEVAAGNLDLSRRTEEAASITQQTVFMVQQISDAVSANAETAGEATHAVHSAVAVAQKGGQVVTEVVSTMDRITESARRIGDITAVIDGIAFQTNILALNAAVEAARAGEQGRGFAVVASEVRVLAQRSATAAREIKQLIQSSAESVEAGAGLAGEAGRTMCQIVQAVSVFNDIIRRVSASSSVQAGNVQEVLSSIERIDEATQRNAAMVEQSAAASSSMKEQSGRLMSAIDVFRV